MIIRDPLTRKFYTKALLKTYVETQPNGLSTHILFARDRDEQGKKTYHCLPIEDKESIKQVLATNSNVYEILLPSLPIKPYFDLEMERVDITKKEGYELVQAFIKLLKTTIKKEYNIVLDAKKDFTVLEACRTDKISFHVIIQNKIFYTSMVALKQFIMKFRLTLQHNEQFLWNTEAGEHRVLMDVIPYGSDQVFKCINQSKLGKNNIMTNESADPADTLVRLYYGVGDREGIEFNETVLTPEILSQKSKPRIKLSKKDKQNESDTHKLYETTGITLMANLNLTYDDLKEFPVWKQYLYLIPNSTQPRTVFVNVGFALRNMGATKEDYRDWAKLSKKYTMGSNIDKFHTFITGERAFQLPFLKELAKRSHPAYFEEGLQMMEEYLKPNFLDIRIISEDCEFVSMNSDNVLAPEKLVLLIARLGGGKTQAIKRLIREKRFKRVLFVSPRITFSQFVAKEFNTSFYLDEGVNLHDNFLTISMESLWKIRGNQPYDLIVLDEIEANLSVFSSVTCKHQLEVFNLLKTLIDKSQKTIFAGAFITQKSIDFITSFHIPVVCLKNTTPPIKRQAIQIDSDVFILKLLESIRRGEKNYVCYSSLTNMKNHMEILHGCSDPLVKNIMMKSKGLSLFYSSESDDIVQKETLQDMEKHWGFARLVMTTPTITVGNSYSPPEADFDNVWICSTPTCIVADTFQSHRRVRHTKSNILYYSFPPEKALNSAKRFFHSKLNILNTFYERNETNAQQLLDQMKDLIEKRKTQILMDNFENRTVDLENLYVVFSENRHRSPAELKALLMFNFKEQTLSNCYYKEMFESFLQLNNYETAVNTDMTNDDKEKLNGLIQNAVSTSTSYESIPVIDEYDLQELKKNQLHKQATRLDKLKIERYYFDEKINPRLSLEAKDGVFKEYALKTSNKCFFNNFSNGDIPNSLYYL